MAPQEEENSMAAADIRYDRLGYVALNVTDLARSAQFYESVVGLTPVASSIPGQQMFRCTGHHHDILLCQAPEPGLKRVGWSMESRASLSAARSHLASLGIAAVEIAADELADLGLATGFRATEPNSGATFEFFHGMAAASGAFVPTHTKIVRLGHTVLRVRDRLATEAFLTSELNFRLSDSVEGAVSFLRCHPNPLHHSLGISGAPVPGFHHVNFMVTEVDDVGKALWRCKANGADIVFGPGRHPPSESMFLYFLDPDGMTVEYSFGMETFPEADPRPPRLLPMRLDSIDYWGGAPDKRFASVGSIEALVAGA